MDVRIGTLFARSIALFMAVFGENILENVRGRNFNAGHRDVFEPPLLRAPPNSLLGANSASLQNLQFYSRNTASPQP